MQHRENGTIELTPFSLLHVPFGVDAEDDLDPDVKSWLAFTVQKMDELATLGRASTEGRDAAVSARVAAIDAPMLRRSADFATRSQVQRQRLGLPSFPTKTIRSFPKTAGLRRARSAHAKGALSNADYKRFLEEQTAEAIRWQEEIDLDVLVHGEFERNDMVHYFGEQLAGFA